jgi:hypothetical protein
MMCIVAATGFSWLEHLTPALAFALVVNLLTCGACFGMLASRSGQFRGPLKRWQYRVDTHYPLRTVSILYDTRRGAAFAMWVARLIHGHPCVSVHGERWA